MDDNETVLEWVEESGGGYVWEDDIFCVAMMDVAVGEDGVDRLCTLRGVRQLALNAVTLSAAQLRRLASIHGLQSLVLKGVTISKLELDELSKLGPAVECYAD